jgi:predicted secreted protein
MQRTFQFDYGNKVFIKQPQATDYYADVANDAWYSDALVMCEVNEIFPAGGNFSPDRPVTRIETAKAIYRSFNAKGISVPMIMMMPVFEDTEGLNQTETNAVVFVNNTGIMKGYVNRFRPYDNLTRAELAGVIARCVELVALDENYQGQTNQLKIGQSFIIGLTSNPSTGYEWQVRSSGDPGIIRLSDQAFREPPATVIPVVGQAGEEFFQFQGVGSGTTQIELVYSRPWESVQPAKIFSVKVEVS